MIGRDASQSVLTSIDHLVYAAPDLDRAVEMIARRTGIRAAPGGRHPAWGTHNALLALGPAMYLEIIAPDAELPAPKKRPFGIDTLLAPRLAGWAAKRGGLAQFRTDAVHRGVPLGEVMSGNRTRPDGTVLSWMLTDLCTTIAHGVVPFFIDWGGSPHPAQSAPSGLALVELRAEHPEAAQVQKMLSELGLDLPVARASVPALIAAIETPRGRVELR